MVAMYSPRWLEHVARDVAPMAASAQVVGCQATGNSIIKNYCADGVVYAEDLKELEKTAVLAP
jgi:hypothetical protein